MKTKADSSRKRNGLHKVNEDHTRVIDKGETVLRGSDPELRSRLRVRVPGPMSHRGLRKAQPGQSSRPRVPATDRSHVPQKEGKTVAKRVFPSFLQKTIVYSSILYIDLFIMNGMIFYISCKLNEIIT
jgi:hypothetical protein